MELINSHTKTVCASCLWQTFPQSVHFVDFCHRDRSMVLVWFWRENGVSFWIHWIWWARRLCVKKVDFLSDSNCSLKGNTEERWGMKNITLPVNKQNMNKCCCHRSTLSQKIAKRQSNQELRQQLSYTHSSGRDAWLLGDDVPFGRSRESKEIWTIWSLVPWKV